MLVPAVEVALQVALLATFLAGAAALPAAWLLGRRRFRGRTLLGLATLLPLLLPPTVLAYYLIVLLSRSGPLHEFFLDAGFTPTLTSWGMVLAAALGSFPLLARTAQVGFEQVDPRLEDAARTLGRSELAVGWTITLPLASRGVLLGGVLSFCRALGDTLLTLVVAAYLGSGPMNLEPPLGRGLAGWPLALGLLLLALLPLVTAAASAGRRQGRRA
jgi:molybdate transport system permease protein